jgi:hypothetical protein
MWKKSAWSCGRSWLRFNAVDARFEAIDERFDAVDQRFDAVDKQFGYLYMHLSAMIGLNGVIVGTVVWLARRDKPMVQRHYDELVERDRELERELRALKRELTALRETGR